MQKYSSRQLQLKNLKRQAHRLAKERNISKGEALQALAKEHNFKSWQELRDHVLVLTPSDDDKIPFQEYDSGVHKIRQVIGVSPIDEENTNIQIRISMVSLFDQQFPTIKDLRDFFDREISRIFSNSKSHAFVFFLIYENENITYPVSDFEGFLDSLKIQYPKIINFNIRSSNVPPTIEVIEDWIDETNQFLDNLLRPFQ
jgi:hypothetical protein